MVVDYLPKPLNRTLFKNYWNTIIGVDDDIIEYYKIKYENANVKYQNVLEVEEMVHPNQSFKC